MIVSTHEEPILTGSVLPASSAAVDHASGENDDDDDVFVFPTTATQRRFWLLDQLVPGGNPALNMPLAVRLSGQLDAKLLGRSFTEILHRHEVLRTTFHCEKGQLQQMISPVASLQVPWWTSGISRLPSAPRCPIISWPRMRNGPLTWRGVRSSARGWYGWHRASICCSSRFITSSPMGGATEYCCASWAKSTRRSSEGSHRHCLTSRSSSPIMPSGSRPMRTGRMPTINSPTGGKRFRVSCPY